MQTITRWINEHPSAPWLVGLSLLVMIVGSIAASIAVVRLPADFFQRPAQPKKGVKGVILSVVGWVLVAAGLAMMILPGPGVIVILAGIMLADFPGKRRVVQWVLSRGSVLSGMNRLRARYGKPPLNVDDPPPIVTNHTPPPPVRV